jgi:thiol-disulfide isomerase/thioredoxin
VRRAQLGAEYNDLSSAQREVDPAALVKVEAGLAEWQAWWQANRANWSQRKPVAIANAVEPLRPAPEFALPDLAGETVRLTELRGQPVLVNFWATWCTACWSELPELVKLQERYGDDLVILGISLDGLPDQHELEHGHKESDHAEGDDHDHAHGEPAEPAHAGTPRDELVKLVGGFAKQKGLNYRILLDPEGVSSLVYQGNELPVNVFIDAGGKLRRRFVGPRSPAAFDAMIAELTAKPR